MALTKPDGTVLTGTTLVNATNADSVTYPSNFALKTDVYEDFKFIGRRSNRQGKRLRFKAGEVVTQAQINDALGIAEFVSASPNRGPAAGGTKVLITGARLGRATGVTFGGTAGTSFTVIDHSTIVVTTPAKTAGTYDIVIQHPNGNVTAAAAYTYV